MLVHPSNFLLLDEPTNHLDMRAKDVLLEALQDFTGTIVFVSHDRYFLEHLANRVFEVGEGEVRVFSDNYADYLWRKGGGSEQIPTLKDVPTGAPDVEPTTAGDKAGTAKRINPMKLKQMQDQAQSLESRIAELESAVQASELALSDFSGPQEAARLSSLLEAQRAELERAMAEWEQVTEQIEATA
jgi:ATP-binding cassette, subfamily F, member 3